MGNRADVASIFEHANRRKPSHACFLSDCDQVSGPYRLWKHAQTTHADVLGIFGQEEEENIKVKYLQDALDFAYVTSTFLRRQKLHHCESASQQLFNSLTAAEFTEKII